MAFQNHDGAAAAMDDDRPHGFRFQLRTLLFIVALLSLLLVVIIQQVQIGRMRQSIDAGEKREAQAQKQQDKLTTIIRELRDLIERHR
jgi:cytochrome c-type biogenesis protein CcmH/NrfG